MFSCSSVSLREEETSKRVDLLTQEFMSLSSDMSLQDSQQVSQLLIDTTQQLAKKYKMIATPRMNNILINLGFRDRGLCCHWAEDLHLSLREIQIESLRFDWLASNLGKNLQEHSAIVIYATDSSWEDGIVYDPWRKSGMPFWTKVSKDSYAWKYHPLNGNWDKLRCK